MTTDVGNPSTASDDLSLADGDRWTALAQSDDWVALDIEFARGGQSVAPAAQKWFRSSGRALMTSWLFKPEQRIHRASRLAVRVRLETSPKRLLRDLRREFEGASSDSTSAAMNARGPEWLMRVIQAAESERADRPNDALPLVFYRIVSRAVIDFGMAPPTSDLYVEGWSREFEMLPWVNARHQPTPAPGVRLSGVLDATPDLVDTVLAALQRPNGFRRVAVPERVGSLPAELARRIIAAGERSAVIDACVETLARSDAPTSQKNVARLLSALEPQPGDIAPQLPLILGAAATCADAFIVALLPTLLDSRLESGDLVELGQAVLLRKAKAPKTTLVRWLAVAIGTPSIEAAARELLLMASASDDIALAAAAKKARGKGSPAAERPPAVVADADSASVPWAPVDPALEYPGVRLRSPIERSPSGFAIAASEGRESGVRGSEGVWLDTIREWHLVDPKGLRAALLGLGEVHSWHASRALHLAAHWARHGGPRISYKYEYTMRRQVDGKLEEFRQSAYHWPRPTEWFTDFLVVETLTRPRDGTGMLSAVRSDDGTISVGELAARIRSWPRRSKWSPYDLQQTLWRLRTDASAGQLDALNGATLRGPRLGSPDGVALIRRWLAGERFLVPGVQRAFARIDDMEQDPAHPIQFLRAGDVMFWDIAGAAGYLDVRPFSADVLAARSPGGYVNVTPALMSAPGPWGHGLATYLTALTVSGKSAERSDTALAIAALSARKDFDVELYTREVHRARAEASFPLGRAADTWEQIILLGGFEAIWPSLSSVMDAGARADRLPAGFADLLSMVRRHCSALPTDERIPESVIALADRKGASKAQLEARALREARR